MRDQQATIHETAIVELGATIGSGVVVWHHSHIRGGATVGHGCSLGKNVYVAATAVLGARCRIQNNVSLYDGVILEDDVFVGPSAVFTNDRFPRADNASWSLTTTVVRQGASIGANSTLLSGLTIGPWAVVGAGSVVTHDVPAHAVVVGNPARWHAWACRCGRVLTRLPSPGGDVVCQSCDRVITGLGA